MILVPLDIQRHTVFELPYNHTIEHLRLEEGTENSRLEDELDWLMHNATEEELPRILTAALILHSVAEFPIADCISTAIIWERG